MSVTTHVDLSTAEWKLYNTHAGVDYYYCDAISTDPYAPRSRGVYRIIEIAWHKVPAYRSIILYRYQHPVTDYNYTRDRIPVPKHIEDLFDLKAYALAMWRMS